ncbi:TPA: hypothetical protein ACGE8T_003075 [Klebsiella pneumoniae]
MSASARQARLLTLEIRPPRLLSISEDGAVLNVLIADLGGTPDGIQVDRQRGHIYWTNMGEDFDVPDGTLERCELDGTQRIMLIGDGQIVTLKQLVLTADHMYWCDREGMAVVRARRDGTQLEELVRRGRGADDRTDVLRHCVGIAIDEKNGYVYWTQKGPDDGGDGRIFRAPLQLRPGESPDVRSDIELIIEELPEPIDLALDGDTGTLYWTDRGGPPDGNSLNRARISALGLVEHEVITRGLKEGIGLTLNLAARVAYVTDLGGQLLRIHLDTSASTVLRTLGPLTGSFTTFRAEWPVLQCSGVPSRKFVVIRHEGYPEITDGCKRIVD